MYLDSVHTMSGFLVQVMQTAPANAMPEPSSLMTHLHQHVAAQNRSSVIRCRVPGFVRLLILPLGGQELGGGDGPSYVWFSLRLQI